MVKPVKHVFATILYIASGLAHAEERSVLLSVPGMKCPACPITVMVAIKRVTGVKSVDVDFDRKLATVSFDDQLTTTQKLQEAAKNVGFATQVLSDE